MLEEAIRVIASSLLEKKHPHFTNIINQKIANNPALRPIFILKPSIYEEESASDEKNNRRVDVPRIIY